MNKFYPLDSRCFVQIISTNARAHKLFLMPSALGLLARVCPWAPLCPIEVGASVAGCGSQWAMALQQSTTSASSALAAIDPGF